MGKSEQKEYDEDNDDISSQNMPLDSVNLLEAGHTFDSWDLDQSV